jgi:glycyl-tRNA synthetase alpha chain
LADNIGKMEGMSLQDLIMTLERFWADYGCAIHQPYNTEVGAGTFNPASFLRALGPEPWKAAHVEPSRRPRDGRYGENPMRVQQFLQYQVVVKPSPADIQDVYLDTLVRMGIDPRVHDVRFAEDDWESPTLGAWGLGWQVWLDGMEITQFTYFQQAGGLDLDPITCELTYGLERIAMCVQEVDSINDIRWNDRLTWKDICNTTEVEFSGYNFLEADVDAHREMFEFFEKEAARLAKKGLVMPAYDFVLKCSHMFNMLDARGAISVTERASYILRVRKIARMVAKKYWDKREELGFPLLRDDKKRKALDLPPLTRGGPGGTPETPDAHG